MKRNMEAHLVSLPTCNLDTMFLTYCYRLLPTRRQYIALEWMLEGQRELYNAALEERIGAYQKAGITRTFFDQAKALTVWRQSDSEACRVPVALQRETLIRLERAFNAFFRRLRNGEKPGFPRFRGEGRFDRHHVLTCRTSSDADYAWGFFNRRRRAVIEEGRS
jgi:transposase